MTIDAKVLSALLSLLMERYNDTATNNLPLGGALLRLFLVMVVPGIVVALGQQRGAARLTLRFSSTASHVGCCCCCCCCCAAAFSGAAAAVVVTATFSLPWCVSLSRAAVQCVVAEDPQRMLHVVRVVAVPCRWNGAGVLLSVSVQTVPKNHMMG